MNELIFSIYLFGFCLLYLELEEYKKYILYSKAEYFRHRLKGSLEYCEKDNFEFKLAQTTDTR